jgi:hypothetical protein
MEEFLLEIDGRLLRVLIEDLRGADGVLPTLICRAARTAQVFPLRVEPPADAPPRVPSTGHRFPGMPSALVERLEREDDQSSVHELTLDLSALPSGTVPFGLDEFSAQALRAANSGTTSIKLDSQNAAEWGIELVGA